MYLFSLKSFVSATTLISAAFAINARSPKPNGSLSAHHGGVEKARDYDTVVTVVVKKPVATICVTETSGSLSGSVYTYSTATSTAPYSNTNAGYTTSTILSTSTYTITSCAPTVISCPLGVVTETVFTYTTVCPLSRSSTVISTSTPVSSSTNTSASASLTVTASGSVSFSSSSSSAVVSPSSSVSSASSSVSSVSSSSSSASSSLPGSSSTGSTSLSSTSVSSTTSGSATVSSNSSSVTSSTSATLSSTSSSSSLSSSASNTPSTATSSTSASSTSSLKSSSSSTSSSASATQTNSSSVTSSSSVTTSSTSSSISSSASSTQSSSSSTTSSASSKISSTSGTSTSISTPSSSSSSSTTGAKSSTSSSTSATSTSSSTSSSSSASSSTSQSSSSSSPTSSSSSSSNTSKSSSSTSTTSSTSSSSLTSTSSSSRTSSSSTSQSSSSSVVSTTSSSLISSSSSISSTSSSSFTSSRSSITTSSSSSSKTSSTSSSTSSSATPSQTACYYWMENIKKQGIAPFNAAPGTYQVFRNVKDFGAKGDGVTDDTAAINLAISSGGRCAPGTCASSTTTPAIVYFPSGTYLVTGSIIDYYYTQMIGNPNCLPIIKASSSFTARWVIDADVYEGCPSGGCLSYGATNIFWRQIRNFVIDLTSVPAGISVASVHWPTAQATSLQNILFKMSSAVGTQHEGVFCESGSGGFMTDLTFYGGLHGALFANQQFTMRNLTFHNAVTAISMAFDWGWTFTGVSINNCAVGIDMTSYSTTTFQLNVGSLTIIDSIFSNTPIGIATNKSSTSLPVTANSLIIENVQFNNVPVIVSGYGSTSLLSGSTGSVTVAAWGQGNYYSAGDQGPNKLTSLTANFRPGSLTTGTDYYERSKPQYAGLPASSFISVRNAGCKGDGVTDDSDALIAVIATAAAAGKIVYFDAGYYLVTKTIYIPSGSKITGETYPVILSSGAFFADVANPKPVVQVGRPGETGTIEWSDMIVSTKGAQAGAILIEWNLDASSSLPAGMWDVHTRIGGFAGSSLSLANCPTTTNTISTLPAACVAAFMSMHVTSGANNLYMENVWLWTADHDVEDPSLSQISIFTGRGLLVESISGNIWMYGTAVEHHGLYQYQLSGSGNVFMGQIQTETPYYQPNPPATIFPTNPFYNDPIFSAGASAWGLRVVNSAPVLIYGAGLYSFFSNYNVHCSDQGNGETCQNQILSIEESIVSVYNLNTVGTTAMITADGNPFAKYSDNLDGFVDTIAFFRS